MVAQIVLSAIIIIESSGNPMAFNKRSQARGLCQVTPIVLKEWNNFHSKEPYTLDDLFNPKVNKKIAAWYINKRIPQMLKHFNLPDNITNRLIAYNWGIGSLLRWYQRGCNASQLPDETRNYIRKYKKTNKQKIRGQGGSYRKFGGLI